MLLSLLLLMLTTILPSVNCDANGAPAPFRVTATLGSSAVIQRDTRAIVWGFGDVGAEVCAKLDGAPVGCTSVLADGVWRVSLPPQPASVSSHILTFTQATDGATQTLEDILFGDVYMCGGQSNAQFTLPQVYNAAEEVRNCSGQIVGPALEKRPHV